MSETATLDSPSPTLLPADLMLNFLATLLAPMFATATGGDLNLARTLAIETLNLYRTENYAGLITAAQIIAFGLASVGSLSLSMDASQNLSTSMIVRLKANANALSRTAEKLGRCLHQPAPTIAQAQIRRVREPLPDLAEVQAGIEAARQAVAQAQEELAEADTTPAEPTPEPAPLQRSFLRDLTTEEAQHRMIWASGMIDVADEFAASLHTLPPAEQEIVHSKIASIRRCVASLLSGGELPQLPAIPGLPMRPFPGR